MSAEEKKPLTYEQPTLGRRFAAYFFDVFLFAILGYLFLLGSSQIMIRTPSYLEETSIRNEIAESSHLYVVEEGALTSLPDYLGAQDWSQKQKAAYWEERLDYFFEEYVPQNTTSDGLSAYEQRKAEAKEGDQNLFDAQGNRATSSPDYEEAYCSFYENCYADLALGYLRLIPSYVSASRGILLQQLAWGFASFSLSFLLNYLVVPCCFRRGKKTLGMYLNRLAYLDARGLSITYLRLFGQFAIRYFLVFVGSAVAFLIPLFVGIGMAFFSKSKQSLAEYLSGSYLVYDAHNHVYLDEFETNISVKTD